MAGQHWQRAAGPSGRFESTFIIERVNSDERLLVNEIFYSIQGESSFSGYPCVFVRLTACNLRCVYCDTQYAFHEGRWIPIEDILAEVLEFQTPLVEITGGEPLLQKPVHSLVSNVLEAGKQVLIETGGSLDISGVDPRAILIYDIKCPDSGMAEKNRWENLEQLRNHDEIKFVISSRQDYEWAVQILTERRLALRHIVLFSPAWNILAPDQLAGWILEDRLPVRLQVQLHKVLWGERRGV
ncbi:MAG TPA: radical SAM protein [Acidobacteriota bacterium]|nr:radical SAM protein [Acidobacteriota bacterium]